MSSLSLMTWTNKLEQLSLVTLSIKVLYLWVKLGLDKYSCLFGPMTGKKEKNNITLNLGTNLIKQFQFITDNEAK